MANPLAEVERGVEEWQARVAEEDRRRPASESGRTVELQLNPGAQDGFVRSEAQFVAMMGGSGSAKTTSGVIKGFHYNLENAGARGVITEPIYSHIQDVLMPVVRTFFGEFEGQLWQEQGKGGPNHQIVFTNGSLILLKAAEAAERLVGFELAWALMDEACSSEGGSQELAYFNLVGRLRQKGFRHWLGLVGTPSGYNWVWREWVDAPSPGHILFRAATAENAENLPEGYIERMEATYGLGTPMYRQYVLGEFVAMEGLVLATFDPDTMILPWAENELFLRKVAGIDFGVHSPTAVVEVALSRSNHRWLRQWLYKRECDDESLVRACMAAMDEGVTLFVCDPSAKERIAWLAKQGIPAIKAPSNLIERRVKTWLTPLGQGLIRIDRNSQFLIREVMGLSWARRRGRELETDKFDVNTPDHAFDASAYALMLTEIGVVKLEPVHVRYHL